ncbi:unnamed protein product [marine sediment metagenome]|uniref:Uncharacterized protein n=1 Tax=marine sediment metagenome TaxID=412755 RepID=X1TAU2_9ZZZZ
MAWNSTSEKAKRATQAKVVEMRSSGKGPSEPAGEEKAKDELAKERGKDLHSGMELLELDFLLSIVENTKGDDKNDVTMRKLNFNELLRREELNEADSNALKVYAINDGNLYSKDIQCEAMKELTTRTTHKSKRSG